MSKAKAIAAQITENNAKKMSLYRGSISHSVPGSKNGKNGAKKIDISNLTELIEINPEKMVCRAESGITLSELVRETLKYNLKYFYYLSEEMHVLSKKKNLQ